MAQLNLDKAQFFAQWIGTLSLIKPWLRKMGIKEIIDRIYPSDSQAILTHGEVIELMVANRLHQPCPLYEMETWAKQVDLRKVYGLNPDHLNDDRLGRALDALGEHLPVLKGEIVLHIAKHFQISLDKLHWDLTTVQMTGEYPGEETDPIRISYTKTHPQQPAQKSFKLGLDIANDGQGPVPIWYESLDGNASGFEATISNMENIRKHLRLDRVIRINDRGCFSAQNVALTREQGFHLISSISWTSRHEQLFLELTTEGIPWAGLSYLAQGERRKKDPVRRRGYAAFEIAQPVQYGNSSYPFRLIFVKSDGKIERDRKARTKHLSWIKEQLAHLQSHLGHPRNQNRLQLMGRVERILRRYQEGKYFKVNLSPEAGPVKQLEISVDTESLSRAEQLDGIYVIGTTLASAEASLDEVFTLFKEQYKVEQANRYLKGPIRVRPIFLQNPKRIEAILMVIFLALLAYMLMERVYRANVKEPKESKVTTRRLLARFGYYCVTICLEGEKVRVIPNAFSPVQQRVFEALGLGAG